jgi:hypothetical protein
VQLKVKSQEDFWAGFIFIGIGLLAAFLSLNYPMGTPLRMGPGFFPAGLGILLIVFGSIILALSFRLELENPEHVPWAWRPWVALTGSIILFGLMMQFQVGFVPSLMALIVGSSLAHKDVHILETALLAILLPATSVAIFIHGLGLPYRLFWWSY